MGYKIENCMSRDYNKVDDLQEGLQVQIVDSEEWYGGSRDEYADLIYGIVCGVECSMVLEWCLG
jgi:hypothetical protein